MQSDEAFLMEIRDDPTNESLRLAYADWLDQQQDSRADYVRAEVEAFRTDGKDIHNSPLWAKQSAVDPVWAARVSRAPFGILVPGLTFSESGPKIEPADLRVFEKSWETRFPPDYAAFLLTFNGGRPSRPCLYSYVDSDEGAVHMYDPIRFFSTTDRDAKGRRYLRQNPIELYDDHICDDADEERLSRLAPIAAIDRGDGSEAMLALDLDDDGLIAEVIYFEHAGVDVEDGAHSGDSFTSLLMDLCEERK